MAERIPHWLTKQAHLAPHERAIETDQNSMTFLQLKEASERYARKLAQLGVTEGTHVGILSTNELPMAIAIHALSYLRAVCVMLNTRLTEEELTYQLKDAEVYLVLTSDRLETGVKQMDLPVHVKTFSSVHQLSEKQIDLQEEISLDDPFTIMYTSGTTGFPKGVVHTYGNHWWSAISSVLNLGLDQNDKWLAPLPFFHVSGFSILMRSIIYGMPVYVIEKFEAQIIHDAMMNKGVTIVSVVTVMLQRLMTLLANERYPKSLRCMLLGGGPAPQSLLEKAKEKGIPVFQSYGMTETSSQIVTLRPQDALQKIGSSGKPLFPAQLQIHEKDCTGVGEIYVKGPMVSNGYFANERANEEVFQHGWLKTGDLGYVDEEGFLYVVDRRKDLIISGGENIYPSEIENVLSNMDGIQEVGVIGKHDDTWGKVPVAFIVPHGEGCSEDEVKTYAKKHLASYKIPTEIYFVDELPRNASNKLVRHRLEQWLKS
ncbi:MAG TPA: o-succinylbenzoate--CoA ligase [Bacillota bacterium]